MIDEGMTALHVLQQCFHADGDRWKGACVLVRTSLTHCNIIGRQQSRKIATSLRLGFSTFPPLAYLPHFLWQQAWSHLLNRTTNSYALSRHIYHFRATKTPCCASGSAGASVSLDLQMLSQNRETYNPCKLYMETVYRGIYCGGYSDAWKNSYLISRNMRH